MTTKVLKSPMTPVWVDTKYPTRIDANRLAALRTPGSKAQVRAGAILPEADLIRFGIGSGQMISIS